MATFVDKEYPLRSANAEFMPTLVHAVFLDALTRIDLQKTQPFRSRAFLRGTDTGNVGECELC
ncbi:hypothetical protein V1279_005006 [Bradyrhizobium sp. AZCC 1610]|uniref:hypothetical protein n=1 Tax=Bradyrhizobium sp. AZCC 1610 TaxID=3117020 RepID=UPI002FEFCFB5